VRTPLAIDLFCGLGGWTEGLLAEGWRVVGFDIERHHYGEAKYPAQLVLQDVLTIHGRQFASADLIVASPPCQAYSYRAMPWKRAKALPPPDNSLFEACFRIQQEACEAAGRFIPLVVENVCGAQKWVGRARWHFGSFYLWGDVPALMPITRKNVKNRRLKVPQGNGASVENNHGRDRLLKATKNDGGSWFNVAHNTTSGKGQNPDGRKAGQAKQGAARRRERRAVHEHVKAGLKRIGGWERNKRVARRGGAGSRQQEQQEQRPQSRLRAHRQDPVTALSAHCSRVVAARRGDGRGELAPAVEPGKPK
jgi:hypothetical protein